MQEIYNVYKPLGWTPLEAIQKLKAERPELSDLAITYAGRLDPAAEGVLVLLSGRSILNKDFYLNLNKSYTAEVIFGFETDTFDTLGICRNEYTPTKITPISLENVLLTYQGKKSFDVPAYSSIPVLGKPLFQWARENKIHQIKIPQKEFFIQKIILQKLENKTNSEIKGRVEKTLCSVNGDFRQKQIRNRWDEVLDKTLRHEFQVAKIKIQCSSGTYVRSIAQQLGKDLGVGATLLGLIRTDVGHYSIKDSIKLEN
ncbi:MAG: hypothetical protein NVSMB66_4300 [Candidatus Doudnabacteria bacterium]